MTKKFIPRSELFSGRSQAKIGRPLLTREEEAELLRRAHAGDRRSRDELVERNLRLVLSLAGRYAGRGLEFEDLFQEGVIGLQKAVERFDLAKLGQVRLATYATFWIEATLRRAIDLTGRPIRLPVRLAEIEAEVKRLESRLPGETGRQPTEDEIAAAAGISAGKLRRLRLGARIAPVSLDQPAAEGGSETVGETLAVDEKADPCGDSETAERRRLIEACLARLRPAEAAMIRCRFLGDMTLEEAADALAEQGLTKNRVSRERARQIEAKALKKLRRLLPEPDEL